MNLGWKIYFWFNTIFGVVDMVNFFFAFHTESVGDGVQKIFEVVVLIGLFAYAYKKKIVSQLYWRIFLWLTIAYSALQYICLLTKFKFASSIFLPKHAIEISSQVPSFLSDAFVIPCLIMGLLTLYALFVLAYRKFKEEPHVTQDPHAKKSALAVASLILGLLGLVFGPLLTLPAFITGIFALRNIHKGEVKGSGFAWTGIAIFLIQTFVLYVIIIIVIYIIKLP